MKAKVTAHMGDIFEGKADLTVLPCGAKPSWSASVDRWIDTFELPTPKELMKDIQLSDVSQPFPFPGPQNITKYIAYGASVLNDPTTPEAIKKLGEHIGSITKSHGDIRIVESVLLGTGYGKLSDLLAAKSLADGFQQTADPKATLWIFMHGSDRVAAVRKEIEGGFLQRVFDASYARIGIGGVGFDLKKYLDRRR